MELAILRRGPHVRKELFARLEGVGRDIENRVTGNDSSRLKDQGLIAESTAAADYGSAEHHERFAESLENTGASEIQISGRLAAARSEGTHPSAAVSVGQACGEGPQVPSGCSRRLRAGKERSQPLTPGIPCQAGHSRRLQRTRPGKRGSHD